MKLVFYKYHGTGNDFILIDNRNNGFKPEEKTISLLCRRRFGVGADGLMTLNSHPEVDFEMKYYNSDGREATMCGNGGRCITSFASFLGIIDRKAIFLASDGIHEAEILAESESISVVSLKMGDVEFGYRNEDYFLFDTGSPHYVEFVKSIDETDVFNDGKRIRWDKKFGAEGVNVNFVERDGDILRVSTFERGVEDVTLSCGTGVTAAALAASAVTGIDKGYYDIETEGGNLKVYFKKGNGIFTDIWLQGAVERVYYGEIEI